jgi:hypothetical protein
MQLVRARKLDMLGCFTGFEIAVVGKKQSFWKVVRPGLASISTRNNSVTGMACWAMRPRIRQIG